MDTNFILRADINMERLEEDDYVRNIPALCRTEAVKFGKRITFLTGENGCGKSTLLEGIAVACGLNPEGGTRNFRFSTRDTHSKLGEAIRLTRGIARPKDTFFLRAESFYNVASQIDDYEREGRGYLKYYGGKSLHEQSHGESFLALASNRFKGDSLYLLDEPEAALSPQRQLTLFMIIAKLAAQGTQFLIATHSPILLGIPDAEIFSLDGDSIAAISYEEAGCCQVMEMFMNHRKQLVQRMLAEDK